MKARHKRQIRRYLLRKPQKVDDLAQAVYLRLLRLDDADYLRAPLVHLYHEASSILNDWNEVEQRETDVPADNDRLK